MKNSILLLILVSWITIIQAQTFDTQHYQVNVKVPNSYNRYIEGHTVIDIKILQDNTSEIDLMLLALTIDSIKLNTQLLNYTYNDTTINIQLENSYQTNDNFSLNIYYHGNGHTDDDGWGGYLSSLGYAYNLGVSMSADPHVYGRVWYPCVDNFTDKATYEFNITCQDSRTAICGGTLTNEIDNGDGTKTFTWLLDRETPTYLTSIAVGNYQVYRDTFQGIMGEIPVAIYARSSEIANVPGSFAHLEDIFHIYENRFGAYHWSRVGYVGVPFNGGAMEHAENIAYPNSSINGNLNSETLFAHELSHSWFGNLVTCSTAEDMWLNEGWASYCEALFTEDLYGEEEFKLYNRSRHFNNLQKLHYQENGFWAIYGIPTDMTYSSHVYKKGADVVHSLRNYLGDDVFFPAITSYLNDYQFQSVSSYQFRDYLTAHTPYNLDEFFESWVFDGGWMHFAVDSFTVTPNADQFDVKVFIRQKLKGKTTFGVNNRIPIQFFASNFDRIDTVITISGENDSQTFTIPFHPYTVICDIEEQISDATTDQYKILKTTGTKYYYKELFKSNVNQISDSVLFRIEHNWVSPDNFNTEIENLYIHPDRYWKVDGIFNDDFQANGQFYYSRASTEYLDRDFVTTHIDSVVVLYRPNSGENWQIIPHTRSGSTTSGYMVIDQIQRGEYAFAVWDHHVNIEEKKQDLGFNIYPNPTKQFLTIEYNEQLPNHIQLFDLSGKLIQTFSLDKAKNKLVVSLANLNKGQYILKSGKYSKKLSIE